MKFSLILSLLLSGSAFALGDARDWLNGYWGNILNKELTAMEEFLTDTNPSVGILIVGAPVIRGVDRQGPAAKAGILPWDDLLEINEIKVENMPREQIMSLLSQAADPVNLTVHRQDEKTKLNSELTFAVHKASRDIPQESVRSGVMRLRSLAARIETFLDHIPPQLSYAGATGRDHALMADYEALQSEIYKNLDFPTGSSISIAEYFTARIDIYRAYIANLEQSLEKPQPLLGLEYKIPEDWKAPVEITGLYRNGPAMAAGLRLGDAITKINGLDVTTLPDGDVTSLLNNSDTSPRITIRRKADEITVAVPRRPIPLPEAAIQRYKGRLSKLRQNLRAFESFIVLGDGEPANSKIHPELFAQEKALGAEYAAIVRDLRTLQVESKP